MNIRIGYVLATVFVVCATLALETFCVFWSQNCFFCAAVFALSISLICSSLVAFHELPLHVLYQICSCALLLERLKRVNSICALEQCLKSVGCSRNHLALKHGFSKTILFLTAWDLFCRAVDLCNRCCQKIIRFKFHSKCLC